MYEAKILLGISMAKYTDIQISKDPRTSTGTVKPCGVEHKLGFGMVTLHCSRKAGHDGNHRSHGVNWEGAAPVAPPESVEVIVLAANGQGEISARSAPPCGKPYLGGFGRTIRCELPYGHTEDYHHNFELDRKWVDNPVQAAVDAPMPPPPSRESLQEVEVIPAFYDDKPLWDKIDAPAPPPPKVTDAELVIGVDLGEPGGDRTITAEIVLSPRPAALARGTSIERVVEAEVVTEEQYEGARREEVLRNQNPYAGRMLVEGTDLATRMKKELYDQWCRDQQMSGKRVLTGDGHVLQPIKKR